MSCFPSTIIIMQNNLMAVKTVAKVNNIDCQTVFVSLVLSLNISSATSKRRETGKTKAFLWVAVAIAVPTYVPVPCTDSAYIWNR